jgi:hypothetical protein
VNDEHELMLALFYRVLRVIEHGFSARPEYLLKDGQTLLGGPDHYAPTFRGQAICAFPARRWTQYPSMRLEILDNTRPDFL